MKEASGRRRRVSYTRNTEEEGKENEIASEKSKKKIRKRINDECNGVISIVRRCICEIATNYDDLKKIKRRIIIIMVITRLKSD